MTDNKNIHQLILDLKRPIRESGIKVVSGDTLNRFVITVQDNSTDVSLTGFTVNAVFLRADGVTVMQDTENGVSVSGATVTIDVKNGSYSPGVNTCELQLYLSNDLITTTAFTFEARKELGSSDAVESSDEMPILRRLINLIEDMTANATTLSSSESATATVTETDGAIRIDFGIPRGADGEGSTVDNIAAQDGNIALSAVRYVEQSLTNEQKGQARENIGAMPLAPTQRQGNFPILNVDGTLDDAGVSSDDFVQSSITINGNPLTDNITLSSSDVNAVSSRVKINGKPLTSDITLKANDIVGAVPTTRIINGYMLMRDITLNASDVGAEPIRTSVTVPDFSAWINTALTAGRYLVSDGSYHYYVEIVVDGNHVFQEYWSSEETERYTYYRAGTVSGDTVTWNDWSYNMTNSMMTDYAQKTYVDTAIETAIGSAIGGGY